MWALVVQLMSLSVHVASSFLIHGVIKHAGSRRVAAQNPFDFVTGLG